MDRCAGRCTVSVVDDVLMWRHPTKAVSPHGSRVVATSTRNCSPSSRTVSGPAGEAPVPGSRVGSRSAREVSELPIAIAFCHNLKCPLVAPRPVAVRWKQLDPGSTPPPPRCDPGPDARRGTMSPRRLPGPCTWARLYGIAAAKSSIPRRASVSYGCVLSPNGCGATCPSYASSPTTSGKRSKRVSTGNAMPPKGINTARRPKYLFSGFLECGECGGHLVIQSKDPKRKYTAAPLTTPEAPTSARTASSSRGSG